VRIPRVPEPSGVPAGQLSVVLFRINLKIRKSIGVAIPPSALVEASNLID